MSDKKIVAMPLSKALYILARYHTMDDDDVGFVIAVQPTHPVRWRYPDTDYRRAWESVRIHLHLQTEPKP